MASNPLIVSLFEKTRAVRERSMNLKGVLLAAVLAGAVAAPGRGAQQKPIKADTARFGNPIDTARNFKDYVYGVVKKIDNDGLWVDKTPFGDGQVFRLEKKTKFIHDGKASSLEQLKAGDKVWIAMKRDKKTGEMLAQKVITGVAVTETP
jgi:uncharacterized protein YkvS